MHTPIYLDNNATTLIDPRVQKAMMEVSSFPANPSSVHAYGKKAKLLLTKARETIATYFKVEKSKLFFTSGGTHSLNLLIQGLLPKSGKILTTDIEHPSIFETLKSLQKKIEVQFLSVGLKGAPSVDLIEKNLEGVTLLVFSAVYSETGALLDLEKVADLAYRWQIPLIIDAVALLGKKELFLHPGISGMAFSSHKIHGPKGVGLIYLKDPKNFSPQVFGGNQENGIVPGTENLEGIVGFAKAIELLSSSHEAHMKELRDYFEEKLLSALPDLFINASESRICNISNIAFLNLDAEALLFSLDMMGIYASLGSACSSGALEPSRVLLNMGHSRKHASSSLRFSLSRETKKEEIDSAISSIINLVNAQKNLSLAATFI